MKSLNRIGYTNILTTEKTYLSKYDLIVIPCNESMQPLMFITHNELIKLNDSAYSKAKKYYASKIMNDGEIRIVILKKYNADLMFIKFKFKNKDTEMNDFLREYKNMLKIIELNEYKEILLLDNMCAYRYGYSFEDNLIINRQIINMLEDFVRDKNINVDILSKDI